MMPYRAAVVGLGRIGLLAEDDPIRPKPASHCGAWRAMTPQVELVAVCDQDDFPREGALSRAAAKLALPLPHEGTRCYFADAGEMAAVARPQIVSVATPPETHAQIVADLCDKGLPDLRAIVCEKPLAPTMSEAQAIVDGCRTAGVLLFVNHLRRFDRALQWQALRLRRGVGKPRTAIGCYSGGLREGGTHMLDLMRMFLGEGRVRAASGDNALLDFGGVRAALVSHDIHEAVVFDLTITGCRGVFCVERFGLDFRWETVVPEYPLASGYSSFATKLVRRDPQPRSFFRGMAEHVVAVLDGREPPISTGEDGVAALELIEAIEAAG